MIESKRMARRLILRPQIVIPASLIAAAALIAFRTPSEPSSIRNHDAPALNQLKARLVVLEDNQQRMIQLQANLEAQIADLAAENRRAIAAAQSRSLKPDRPRTPAAEPASSPTTKTPPLSDREVRRREEAQFQQHMNTLQTRLAEEPRNETWAEAAEISIRERVAELQDAQLPGLSLSSHECRETICMAEFTVSGGSAKPLLTPGMLVIADLPKSAIKLHKAPDGSLSRAVAYFSTAPRASTANDD